MDKLFAVILALLLILAVSPAMAWRAGVDSRANAGAFLRPWAQGWAARNNPSPLSQAPRCPGARDAAARVAFRLWLRKKSPGRHPIAQWPRAWR